MQGVCVRANEKVHASEERKNGERGRIAPSVVACKLYDGQRIWAAR